MLFAPINYPLPMPDLFCPRCAYLIAARFVQGHTGVVWCSGCQQPFHAQPDPSSPQPDAFTTLAPEGCIFEPFDDGFRISAPTRSPASKPWVIACFIWNTITLIFVLIALMDIFHLLGGPLPAWVFKIEGNISPAHVKPSTLVWFILFLIPFVLAGLALAAITLYSAKGRVEITVHGDRGLLFTGVGSRGLSRPFSATHITKVAVETTVPVDDDDSLTTKIVIDAEPRLSFARFMTRARRDWMASTLRGLLANDSGSKIDP